MSAASHASTPSLTALTPPVVPPHPPAAGELQTIKPQPGYGGYSAPVPVQDGRSGPGLRYQTGGDWRSRSRLPSMLVGLVLVAVIILLLIQVVYTSLSYSQLQTNGNKLGSNAGGCTCDPVSQSELSSALASLASVYGPNADGAVIRGIQLPDPANYTPVFDFNQVHSTDLITPYGYAKVANIENYPATHNQAISQTLFQLEVDGSNSPHHHPDAVEILFLFQGTIEVTRIEPNDGNTYTNTLTPNMSVIFPRGHIHFQHNIGNEVARYISSLNSELPGVMSEAQRLCDLPYDAILSMFPMQTATSVWAMCGNAGEPIPSNPIQYKYGMYPGQASSTGVGAFFKGPDVKTAKENMRREEERQQQLQRADRPARSHALEQIVRSQQNAS